MHAVLQPLGVDEKISVEVATCLRRVEDRLQDSEGSPQTGRNSESGGAGAALESAGGLTWSKDVGVTAFMLRFGEGLGMSSYNHCVAPPHDMTDRVLKSVPEEIPTRRLYISALTVGAGYFFGGLIPLMPYFFLRRVDRAFKYSCIVTAIILLIFGAVKTHFTGATGGWRGYVFGAVSMLAVGGGAAGTAFGIVRALEGVTHG